MMGYEAMRKCVRPHRAFTAAAYNLVRMRNLLTPAVQPA